MNFAERTQQLTENKGSAQKNNPSEPKEPKPTKSHLSA
jgi:hypothetical protein